MDTMRRGAEEMDGLEFLLDPVDRLPLPLGLFCATGRSIVVGGNLQQAGDTGRQGERSMALIKGTSEELENGAVDIKHIRKSPPAQS